MFSSRIDSFHVLRTLKMIESSPKLYLVYLWRTLVPYTILVFCHSSCTSVMSQFSVLPWFFHSSLLYIRAIDSYIFQSLFFSPLLHARSPFSLKHTCFGHFTIVWSSDPHLKHFRGPFVYWMKHQPREIFLFLFLFFWNIVLQSDYHFHKICTLFEQHVPFTIPTKTWAAINI